MIAYFAGGIVGFVVGLSLSGMGMAAKCRDCRLAASRQRHEQLVDAYMKARAESRGITLAPIPPERLAQIADQARRWN